MGNNQTKQKQDKNQFSKNNFNFIKIVGKGGFGKVWKVVDKKNKKIFALKVISKAKVITKRSVNSVLNQRQLLSKMEPLQNPFLVNMKYAFQDRDNLYLTIDYLDSGDLRYYLNRNYQFNQQQTKFIVRCIMEGLQCVHQKNIIHRDIKPENIIFDKNGYCRITDLGIARYWRAQNANQTSGTPGYMSPQVLMRQNHSFGADYYAVGVIAFQLLIGKRPYAGKDRKSIRDEMLARQVKIPSSYRSISKQGIDFINRMIQRVARKRLGYNGISQILNHPWLLLKKQQKQLFLQQKLISPVIPLQVNLHASLQQPSEPDELQRQNQMLLKKPQVQGLFIDYDYHPQKVKKVSQKVSIKQQVSILKTNYNYSLTTRQ